MRFVEGFASLLHEAHGLPCEMSRVRREVRGFYAPRPLAATLFFAPIRSNSPPPLPPPSPHRPPPFLHRPPPSLQPLHPSLHRLLRRRNACFLYCIARFFYCTASYVATRPAINHHPTTLAKALSAAPTLHFPRISHHAHPFLPNFPTTLPYASPRHILSNVLAFSADGDSIRSKISSAAST
jgi:hypothetical protein